jgi:hypothetical protein
MLHEAYGKAEMKKMHDYGWHKWAMWVLIMTHAAGNAQGLVHYEFIPENKEMYVKILHCLKDVVRRKHPNEWAKNSWFRQCTCTSVIGGQKVPYKA